MSTPNDKQLYLDATQEVESGTQDPALWAKAMALAEGDEGKARYRYITLRVEELSKSSASVEPADSALSIDSVGDVPCPKPDGSVSQAPMDEDTQLSLEELQKNLSDRVAGYRSGIENKTQLIVDIIRFLDCNFVHSSAEGPMKSLILWRWAWLYVGP